MGKQQDDEWENAFVLDVNASLADPDADYAWLDALPTDPGVPTAEPHVVAEFRQVGRHPARDGSGKDRKGRR